MMRGALVLASEGHLHGLSVPAFGFAIAALDARPLLVPHCSSAQLLAGPRHALAAAPVTRMWGCNRAGQLWPSLPRTAHHLPQLTASSDSPSSSSPSSSPSSSSSSSPSSSSSCSSPSPSSLSSSSPSPSSSVSSLAVAPSARLPLSLLWRAAAGGWDVSVCAPLSGGLAVWGALATLAPPSLLRPHPLWPLLCDVAPLHDMQFDALDVGFAHVAALTAAGDAVYCFGANLHGQAGAPPCSGPTAVQRIASPDGKIVGVACGSTHTVLLTSSGNVFTFGSRGDGKLGYAATADVYVPTQVRFPENVRIVKVVCGVDHTIAIDSEGRAWGWGYGQHGQFGTLAPKTYPTPQPIDFGKEKVVDAWCGADYSLFELKQ